MEPVEQKSPKTAEQFKLEIERRAMVNGEILKKFDPLLDNFRNFWNSMENPENVFGKFPKGPDSAEAKADYDQQIRRRALDLTNDITAFELECSAIMSGYDSQNSAGKPISFDVNQFKTGVGHIAVHGMSFKDHENFDHLIIEQYTLLRGKLYGMKEMMSSLLGKDE